MVSTICQEVGVPNIKRKVVIMLIMKVMMAWLRILILVPRVMRRNGSANAQIIGYASKKHDVFITCYET